MDNKKTTLLLVILLLVLVVLMCLRACGVGPWQNKRVTDKPALPAPAADAVSSDEEIKNIINKEPEVAVDSKTVVEAVPETPKTEPVPVAVTPKPAPAQPKPKTVEKPKTAAPPATKPKTDSAVSKPETSKSDLPKPAVQKPRREKIERPVFTNKSGFKPFYVYTDIGSKNNHYSPYGLMGDISAIALEQGSKINPHSGKTCIKITYNPSKGKAGWSGIYWTEPPNNWGDKGYGFNLTGAERISFWARGEKGGEIINNFIMGGIQGKQHEDSDSVAIGPIELSAEWKQYFINIEDADLSNIIGGFCFTVTKTDNPMGAVFYLDDIVYE